MQKLNSYILQSSRRGRDAARDKVFEPDTVHIHGYLYKYFQSWLPTYPYKYTQRITMYALTHNTKSTLRIQLRATSYTHTYISMWLNQILYIPMIISDSKCCVDHNHCKARSHTKKHAVYMYMYSMDVF